MIEPTHIVPYGRPATNALRAVIAQAKTDNPLLPVTVVVASNFVGLSARRLLGSSVALDDGSEPSGVRGIANVSFVTPFQLAEVVGADLLLDTRPITNPVLGAAVRRVLAEQPGPYERVRDHEATEAALAALFAELSNVDEIGIESIAELESSSAQHAVTFYRAIADHLGEFHTEHDLASAAADRDDLADRVRSLGHVVWYLPAPVTPALGRFLDRVLHDAPSSSVILGMTGDTEADEPVLRSCEAAGVIRPADRALAVTEPPTASAIVSVTDAPEEVRVVAGKILELAKSGTPASGGVAIPFNRIGVFYPAPDPYVRIIEQQFAASGIVANGPDQRRLRDAVAGRSLLAALSLPAERWRRDRVMALIAGGPIGFGEHRSFPTTWDELSREAGVVRHLSDWETKLQSLREATEQRLADLDDPESAPARAAAHSGDDRQRRRLTDRIVEIERLGSFVDGLHQHIQAVDDADTWSAKCSAAQQLLVWLLGAEHRHASWPEAEQVAFERVEAALVRLSGLDTLEENPTTAVFHRALRSELDVARGRHGRFGDGVLFGPLSSAVGHDLDAVFVLGAAEGLLPVPRRDDAVLPDDIRIATMEKLRTNEARLAEDVRLASIDQLETKAMRLQHQHRAFLAALAAAPPGAATLTFPRGSLRSSRRALPSRWLLESASALAGRTVYATDFDLLDASVVDAVGSHASGICRPGEAASEDDHDRAVIADHIEQGGSPFDHPVVRPVRSGLELQRSRAGHEFTVFDGNLAGHQVPSSSSRPLSSSRLEAWATCGFRYFLAHVLELDDREDPERLDDITAMDRGSLIHAVLERFIAEAIESGPPAPEQSWTDQQRQRLHEIANEEFEIIEGRGRTGRAVHWQVQRDDLHDTLDRFLEADNVFRASKRATPNSVELAFGIDDRPPVEITLPNGRTLAFRGFADRVDVSDDGRAIVTDYKSGKGKKFDGLMPKKDAEVDPVLAGTTLQLGLYAEAAMRHTGLDAAEANYWLVEAAPSKEFRGYRWEESERRRFVEVLEAITDGIDAGSFAAAPGDWDTFSQTNASCTYCTFDSVCVRNRGEQAEAKADAEGVTIRRRLLPADPATDPNEPAR